MDMIRRSEGWARSMRFRECPITCVVPHTELRTDFAKSDV